MTCVILAGSSDQILSLAEGVMMHMQIKMS